MSELRSQDSEKHSEMQIDHQPETGEQVHPQRSGKIVNEVVEGVVTSAIEMNKFTKESANDSEDNPLLSHDVRVSGPRIEGSPEQSSATTWPKIPFLFSRKPSGVDVMTLQQYSLDTLCAEQSKDGTDHEGTADVDMEVVHPLACLPAPKTRTSNESASKAPKLSVLLNPHTSLHSKQEIVSPTVDYDAIVCSLMKGSSSKFGEREVAPKKPRIRILTSGDGLEKHATEDVLKSIIDDDESEKSHKHNLLQDGNVGLQNLPDQLLDAVLRWLPFAEVSRVGGTCRSLRRVAAALLRREMRSLVARTEALMYALEEETSAQAQGGACMVPVVMRVILHTVLRVLLGEARVLRAVCWRYVRMEDVPVTTAPGAAGALPSPVLCFPGGDVLDEFERLLAIVSFDHFHNDIDPEVVTGLFMRMERFLDHFEGAVEPLLRCALTPFGVKVFDLLGACDTADCVLSVTHGTSDRPFLASVTFELRDASAVDSPPPFDGQMPPHMRLRLLARYLRNNVRWVNFFRPMRELWDLQDEIENRWAPSATGEHRDISRHHTLHQVVMEAVKAKLFRRNLSMPPPRPSPPHLPRKQIRQREIYEQLVLRAEPPLWRETFSRRINPAARALRLGLGCTLELSGADKSLLPLDLEFLDADRVDSATRHPGLSPQTSTVQPPVCEEQRYVGVECTLSGTPLKDLGRQSIGSPTPLVPAQLPLPPTPARGEAMPDWGPWLRLRRSYCAPDAQNGQAPDGWDDYGASLRSGGAYGFRGEVRVTFPPRALSSIVTETVIQVHDTSGDTSITSDRRFSPHLQSTRHICVFPHIQS